MPDLPTGTVTFLFTDLEGSTRLWEEHPEAMKAALARHDEILREAVESNGGHVVKTTGDGIHAAFADPVQAVDASVAAQRGLIGAMLEPRLRIRVGLPCNAGSVRTGVRRRKATKISRQAFDDGRRLLRTCHPRKD